MDLQAVSSLIAARQAITLDEARALVLRVGQQMTATLLAMVDNLAELELEDGRQLLAKLQTDQALTPGQTLQLEAVDVQPEQVTLRLLNGESASSADSNGALAKLGVADTAANRAAFAALVTEGLPASGEAIHELLQLATALGSTTPEDLHAAAFLLANDLPLTSAMADVVNAGQSTAAQPAQLEGQLREQAGQLLAALSYASDEVQGQPAELRSLLTQLAAPPTPPGPPTASTLQALVQQLTLSLEAALLSGLDAGQPAGAEAEEPGGTGGEPMPAPVNVSLATEDASSQAEPSATSVAPKAGSASAPEPATPSAAADGQAPASPGGAPAVAEPAAQASSGAAVASAEPQGSAVPGAVVGEGAQGTASVASSFGANPQAAAAPVQIAASSGTQTSSAPAQPLAAPPVGGDPRLAAPDSREAFGLARVGSEQGSAAPAQAALTPGAEHAGQAQPPAHEVARRLIPALERALDGGAAPPGAAELRQTAERFVQATQFQQIQTILQPTPAEPYVAFPLPLPAQQGEADLRLYVREEGGRARIDPNDVRLVIDLRLSQLKRVSVLVHLYQRQLSCHIETDSLPTQRLLEATAPELQDSLRGLGFAVDPIHCSMAGFASRDATEVELPLAKLGGFNVTA